MATDASKAPLPGAASKLTNTKKLINKQFNLAQARLKGQSQEANRSALENAQRIAAMRGTSGAGFETKLQTQAQAEATKPYEELSTGLESERAGQLTAAAQARDAMKEQQRALDLQRYVSANEMDLNKFTTFVNSSTAFKEAGLDSPEQWSKLFSSGVFQDMLKNAGISVDTTNLPATSTSTNIYSPNNGNLSTRYFG